jgi:membrane protein DedA with SNARE-associated domain
MTGDPSALLLALGSSPWAIAVAIVMATFVLEDVTTIAAAFLAATGVVAPIVALSALFVGIFLGDLGLYGLGAAARTRSWARKLIGERRMAKGRDWLKRRYVPALIGARFMPGFRLPTYAASGFLKLPFWPFAGVAAGAGMAWTTLVFSLVFFFGVMIVEGLGPWRWLLASLLLALVLFGPALADRIVKPRMESGDV